MFIVTEYAALNNAYTATKIIIMYPVGPIGFYLVCAFVNFHMLCTCMRAVKTQAGAYESGAWSKHLLLVDAQNTK